MANPDATHSSFLPRAYVEWPYVHGTERYSRQAVFTQTGYWGYDLMRLNKQQVIDDVLPLDEI